MNWPCQIDLTHKRVTSWVYRTMATIWMFFTWLHILLYHDRITFWWWWAQTVYLRFLIDQRLCQFGDAKRSVVWTRTNLSKGCSSFEAEFFSLWLCHQVVMWTRHSNANSNSAGRLATFLTVQLCSKCNLVNLQYLLAFRENITYYWHFTQLCWMRRIGPL